MKKKKEKVMLMSFGRTYGKVVFIRFCQSTKFGPNAIPSVYCWITFATCTYESYLMWQKSKPPNWEMVKVKKKTTGRLDDSSPSLPFSHHWSLSISKLPLWKLLHPKSDLLPLIKLLEMFWLILKYIHLQLLYFKFKY